MGIPDLNRKNGSYFEDKLSRIDPERKPKWGRLDPTSLMRHLRRAIEVSLGQVEAEDKSIPGLRWLLRNLFFEWFTNWPKGKIKATPVFLPRAEKSFDEERNLLIEAIEEFVDELKRHPDRKTVNPFLGPISVEYWSHIHGIHFTHHFRQFGVVEG